jgi:hypothetical protein
MARRAVLVHLNQQGIAVAVQANIHQFLGIAGGIPLAP